MGRDLGLLSHSRLDKLTFFYILFLWTGIIFLFGLAYYLFSNGDSHLAYSASDKIVGSLSDHIYFSFITATSTGFGDIIPEGLHKIISIIEVVFGLLLLAFVTSKFIAIKQNVILTEMYEISIHERINRIRSSFLLFRQKLGLFIVLAEEKTLRKRDLEELSVHVSSLEDILHDVLVILQRDQKNEYTTGINPVDLELIFHSLRQSFEKLHELVKALNLSKTEWQKENVINSIKKCLNLNHQLLELLPRYRNITPQSIETIREQGRTVLENINAELGNS